MTTLFSKAIIHTHVFLPNDEIDTATRERLKDKLTVVSRYDKSEFPTFAESSTVFGIPLYYVKDWGALARTVEDIRVEGSKIVFDFKSSMRPGQQPVIGQFEKEVQNGKTGFVVDAPPGFGKTVVMLKMIHTLQRTAIVVVPRSSLVEQWVNRIVQHTALKRGEVGVVNGKNVEWQGKRIVVGLVHSLAAQLNDNRTFCQYFGTAVFDEVDRSVPPATFSPVLCMFPAKYRIGASATVTRKDGLHLISKYHIEQTLIKGGDHGRMEPKILMLDYSGSSGYVHPQSAKMNRRGMLLSRLASNDERNKIVCKYIHLIVNSGRRVLVLSDRTEQLVRLKKILTGLFNHESHTIGFYCDTIRDGKTRRKVGAAELRRSERVCTIILATYGKAGIGTDIPDLAGLVYATPQSDVRQTQGRIERLVEGKAQPVVVDIVDTAYKDAVGWSKGRIRYYKNKNLKLKVISE